MHEKPFVLIARMTLDENTQICGFSNHTNACFEFGSGNGKALPDLTENSSTLTDVEDKLGIKQKIRRCGSEEDEIKLFLGISGILLVSTLASLISSLMLHKVRDYAELYKISKKWLWIKTEPIVHRSLLFSTVEKEDSELLADLLKSDNPKTIEEYVNRPNHKGQFALQMSIDTENAKCVSLLLQAGARQHKDKHGKLPALWRLLISDRTSEFGEAINAIACVIIDKVSSVDEANEAYKQLTTTHDGVGECFLTIIEVDQFAKAAVWNKWKKLF